MQPWHLGKLGGFQLATPPVSLLTPMPHPCLHRFFCGSKFPDSTQIIQINQNDWWPRVPPPSFLLQSLPLEISIFLLSSELKPLCARAYSPRLWVHMTNKLSSVSSHPSWTIWTDDSSLSHGVNSWLSELKTQSHKILALIQTMRLLPRHSKSTTANSVNVS